MEAQEKQEKHRMPTPEELEAMMVVPAPLVHTTALLLQIMIYGLPAAAVVFPFVYSPALGFSIIWVMVSPVVYAFLFGVVAGICSLPWQRGIIKGVFPRDVRFPVYAMRKLYGTCWTALYYFKPVYTIILNVTWFKTIVFRLFGYRGTMNFSVAPDSWIRDLPLLRFEEGAYVANKATVGTNICMNNGFIAVGNVTLQKNAMVGHLTMLGVGVKMGVGSEIGVGCMIGLKSSIGDYSSIDPGCVISHRVKVGNRSKIGADSFVGNDVVIGEQIEIPSNTSIPDKAEVYTQEDVLKYAGAGQLRTV